MEQIEAFEEIDASPESVWAILTDFESYPEWNPFVRSISGTLAEGEELTVRIDPPDSRAWTFEPEVVAVDDGRRFAWLGRLLVPFAFDGYHEFRLDPTADGGTRLLQRETFRGALVPLLLDEAEIERGFAAMNRALKERAESRSVEVA